EERSSTGHQLVGDHAESPHVARRYGPAPQLLRRHVDRCSCQGLQFGPLRLRDVYLGDAEIDQDGELVFIRTLEHDVLGLDVAVDDPGTMHGPERGTELT